MTIEQVQEAQAMVTKVVDAANELVLLTDSMQEQLLEINKLCADYADFLLEQVKELRDQGGVVK